MNGDPALAMPPRNPLSGSALAATIRESVRRSRVRIESNLRGILDANARGDREEIERIVSEMLQEMPCVS